MWADKNASQTEESCVGAMELQEMTAEKKLYKPQGLDAVIHALEAQHRKTLKTDYWYRRYLAEEEEGRYLLGNNLRADRIILKQKYFRKRF